MTYASFDYYTDRYGGELIQDADEWAKYERKARRLVDMYTFNRLTDKQDQDEIVKDCVCELAEAVKVFDDNAFKDGGKVISSQSNDGVSVTFDTSAFSFEKQNQKLYNIIYMHLSGSGLLYRGL